MTQDEVNAFYRAAGLPLGARIQREGRVGTLVRRAARLWVDRDAKSPMVRWDGQVDAEVVSWRDLLPATARAVQSTPPVLAEADRLPTEDDFIVGAGRVLRDRGVVCSNSDVGRVYDWLRANLTTRDSEPEDLDSHDDPPRRPLGPRGDG